MSAMANICALCSVNPDLQDSHIISEFLHVPLYEHPHRFRVISSDPTVPERYAQKGEREKLLCRACEQKLGKWEHYAKSAFVDGKGVNITQVNGGWQFQGLHYKSFKLFQMSLLWRMGVSTLDFFRHVELGPHQEKLRITLLNDDPLEPDVYSCAMVAVQIGGKLLPDWIIQPSRARLEHRHVHWLVINGIMYLFFVSNSPPPAGMSAAALNKRGELFVALDDYRKFPLLAEAVESFGIANHERRQRRESLKTAQ